MVTEPPPQPVSPPPPSFRILITDDDAGSRSALADLLAARGFATVQAASGEQAIEIVRVNLVHLVFFDMHMPRMTGLEALQQVRLINDLLPAILVTADATRELIRRALSAQVFSVIPKPVNTTIVLHTLGKALETTYGVNPAAGPSVPSVSPPERPDR
jgi:CheY-like chemotaxis protein